MHHVTPQAGSRVAVTCGASFEVSCFHHQAIDGLGAGLTVTARAEDGTVEAYEMPAYPAWFAAVQWHPEDTAATDPAQLALFRSFVAAARRTAPAAPDPPTAPTAPAVPRTGPADAAFVAAFEA